MLRIYNWKTNGSDLKTRDIQYPTKDVRDNNLIIFGHHEKVWTILNNLLTIPRQFVNFDLPFHFSSRPSTMHTKSYQMQARGRYTTDMVLWDSISQNSLGRRYVGYIFYI